MTERRRALFVFGSLAVIFAGAWLGVFGWFDRTLMAMRYGGLAVGQADAAVVDLGLIPAAVLAIVVSILAVWRGKTVSVPLQLALVAAGAAVLELAAWGLQRWGSVTLATVPFHAAATAFLVVALSRERAARRLGRERDLRRREGMHRVLGQVVSDSLDGIVILDDNDVIIAASRAAGEILLQDFPLTGRSFRDYLPVEVTQWLDRGDFSEPYECVCDIAWQSRTLELLANRSEVQVEDVGQATRHVICLTFRDITNRLRQQQRLAYLARHDVITGALTRQALCDEIDARLGASEPLRIIIIRLNRLRNVTVTLGHQVTEALLRQIYKRLRGISDVQAARLGTDVFGIVLPLEDVSAFDVLIQNIAEILDATYDLEGHAIILESVFGASSAFTAKTSAADALRQAEIALSVHDDLGRQKAIVFAPNHAARIADRQKLDSQLRLALDRREFFLLFQPQVDLKTHAMTGVEALVRWRNAELGVVSPAKFIPFAEETGLIVELGDWVMKEACRQAASWNWIGRLSVNVSPVQFRLGDVVRTVREAAASSGFPANRLDIEITESLFAANDPSILSALDQLRAMGATIAIDDFGTGYSSLSYLAHLPVDKIKIDQSFVRELPSEESKAIIETIVSMAARLNKTVIAEGVETEEQLLYLMETRCHVGQGYYFSRPTNAAELGFVAADVA